MISLSSSIMKKSLFIIPIFLGFVAIVALTGQGLSAAQIEALIAKYKQDPRGPYQDIRWFCPDGGIQMPKEPCEKPGGVQRARYKETVLKLARDQHIFLGQILSTTPFADFWDEANGHARLKQYQLEKYLRAVDDGWVLQKAQYYRGAMQVEDEEAWGQDFLNELLKQETPLSQQFYLLRQLVKDLPHVGEVDRTQVIRALSKAVADDYPAFMDLRIKIHGQPEAADLAAVRAFLQQHQSKLTQKNKEQLEQLVKDMEELYRPTTLEDLQIWIDRLPPSSPIQNLWADYQQQRSASPTGPLTLASLAELLYKLRTEITAVPKPSQRLAMLELSLQLEQILFREVGEWSTTTEPELARKIMTIMTAVVGTGSLELWEWEKMQQRLRQKPFEEMDLLARLNWQQEVQRMVEWGTGMTRAVYRPVVETFNAFEPLAYGFFDDKIRSSLLLPLGRVVGELGEGLSAQANFSNQILDLSDQSSFRGLNPGFALGELVVVSGSPDEIEVTKDKIYIFQRASADLKPVAGIATVSEGNLVSHVQLLARNLGIPNAVLSAESLQELLPYHGQRVFYAVSNRGTVLMKLETDMTAVEKELFEQKERSEEQITVPVDQLELTDTRVLNLRAVNAKDSGKRCGPKAANLGQLKEMFPDRVVEGLVIPFSIFRQHMDQLLPDQSMTYWAFLNETFQQARTMPATASEEYVLQRLSTFREAIAQIPLRTDFMEDLMSSFEQVLGKPMGEIAVFLRSDTNMEDLKDFTGAGLNLTLFNVLDQEKILNGIRQVWASPYTERSYKWRQKYLLNPENVYPSILIIPSVDVDYSGVLITKGVTSGRDEDLTIAFSRGAGGAVDGQAAESYLLSATGEAQLLSPAREPKFRRLPAQGGSQWYFASFESPILNPSNLQAIRQLSAEVQRIFPSTEGVESQGPFDIELGFQADKMWLFQVRPFVENKKAKGADYLASISPVLEAEAAESSSEAAPQSFPRWILGLVAVVVAVLLGSRLLTSKS